MGIPMFKIEPTSLVEHCPESLVSVLAQSEGPGQEQITPFSGTSCRRLFSDRISSRLPDLEQVIPSQPA
jgi:hypothetical protein